MGKKGQCLFCERNEIKYDFIQAQEGDPINKLCQVMGVCPSAYDAWRKRSAILITEDDLRLYRKAKELFKVSRESFGSRELSKKLQFEGFDAGRDRTRKIMKKLKLIVRQRVAYKVTTKRKLGDAVAVNLLNQNFNPVGDYIYENRRRLIQYYEDSLRRHECRFASSRPH